MIILICECFLLGIVGALVGIFYNYTLQTGSIFCRLGDMLDRWDNEGGFKGWIANPLGACIYCSTTWITLLIMAMYWLSWESCPNMSAMIICTLTAIGMQHILIRAFNQLDKEE